MQTTSVSLIRRLRRSEDDAAWNRFVKLYTPLLRTWAKRVGLNDVDAGDLVQDVLVKLMAKLPEFEYDAGRGRFRGWLKTVTMNESRNFLRRRARRAGTADSGVWENVGTGVESGVFEREEYRKYMVQRALQVMQNEFEPATWQACWEFVVSGRPANEVAEELNVTVNAVYLAKSRVLRKLREELDGLM